MSSIRLPDPDDPTARKKWSGLAERFDVHVIGFSNEGFKRTRQFNCDFYGLPGNLWFPVRVFLYYLLVPWLTAYLTLRYSVRNWTAQGPYEAASVWGVKLLLSPFIGPRLIVEAHGDWIESFLELRSVPWKNLWRRILQKISPVLLFPADALRSVSETTRELLKRYGPADRPHRTVPGFTDLDVFLESSREDKLNAEGDFVLYVGALTRLKGLDRLLDALELARGRNTTITLQICGTGDWEAFESEAHQRQLTEYVTFLGELPQPKLRDRYLRSRLLVLPSRTEGLPRVLLESLACYTPFVATETPGSEQIKRDSRGGVTVPQDDNEALAEAMVDLFQDPSKRRELGDRGRAYVESNFSTQQFFKTYEELVNAMKPTTQTGGTA